MCHRHGPCRPVGETAQRFTARRRCALIVVVLAPVVPAFVTSISLGPARTFGNREAKVCGSRAFRRIGYFFRRKARTSSAPPDESAFPLARRLPETPFDFLDDANQLDPYKALGIPFLSAPERIQMAYRERCKLYHPDVNGGQESMEWLLTKRAHSILTDSGGRVAYDSARVTRNAFSATEGVVKFTVVAAQEFGSVVSDATEALRGVVTQILASTRELTENSQVLQEWIQGGFDIAELQAGEGSVRDDESQEKRIEQLKKARKDLEAEANAANASIDLPTQPEPSETGVGS